MAITNLKINNNLTEDTVQVKDDEPNPGGNHLAVKWLSDDTIISTVPTTLVSGYIDSTELLDFVETYNTHIAGELAHFNLANDSLIWADCGHISDLTVPTVACFNDEGEAVARTIPALNADLDHSFLGNLKWELSAHVSELSEAGVACFNNSGAPQVKTMAELSQLIDHAELTNLNWLDSGHFIEETEIPAVQIAAFSTIGNPLTLGFFAIADNVNELLHHDELDPTELDWEQSGHTGTALTLAGFDGYGEAICIEPTNLVDLTVIQEAIEDLEESVETIQAGFFKAFKNPVIVDAGVEWMELGDASAGSQALIANKIIYTLHYQEGPTETYDGIGVTVASGTSADIALALYSADSNGKPGELLWYTSSISAATTGLKTAAFASYTWTTAGAAYKDANNNLVLPRGETIYKAIINSGNVSYRVISECRSIGRPMLASGKPYTGFNEAATYANFPSSATGVAITTQIPVLPLHRL